MTEQESKDLEENKEKVLKIKISTFDYLVSVSRFTETDLLHSGYRDKSTAQAMEMILVTANKNIEKIWKEYIKKYPDK